MKNILIIFKGILVAKNFGRPETAPLNLRLKKTGKFNFRLDVICGPSLISLDLVALTGHFCYIIV